MKAEGKLVRELFEGEQCLVVPVFQRPYVWNRVRNWEPLWADIVAMAESMSTDTSSEPHFLGAVVLDSTDKDAADISVLQVIDGQQRITTLQIALCAIRDAFTTAQVERVFIKALNKLVTNEDQLSTEAFAPYKVWPTLRDREVFASIVDHTQPDDEPDSRLADAYQFFYEETLTWLTENESDRAAIKSLVDALRIGLQLVVIELTANDNAQVIFESLNDRGTPLLPSDLVKNSLFQQLERAGADVEQIFDDHWRRLEAPFWQEEVRQGRLIRTRVDAFFAHYLTMRTGDEVSATGLFNRFKDVSVGMSRDDLVALTQEIAECSDLYRGIVDRSGDDVHDRLLETAETLDTTVLSPVVLYLDRRTDEADRAEAYGYIESWLVRRAVLRSTSKNYNRMLLDLLKILQRSATPFAPTVRTFFLENTSESGRWPTDAEIRDALISAPIFKNLTRARMRMVLRGCERGLRSDTHQIPDLDSLEHVLLATASDDIDDTLRGALGNLTLFPRSRDLSRATDWPARRAILSGSDLELNQQLPESLSGVQITVRGSRLADGFCRTWPHPDTPTTAAPDDDVEEEAPSDAPTWVDEAWTEIQEFFEDLPVGSVSRVEDRMSRIAPVEGGSLEVLTQDPLVGYAFREIAGTLYIEKVPGEAPIPGPDIDALATSQLNVEPHFSNAAPETSNGTGTRAVYEETINDLMLAGFIEEGDTVYHEQPRKGRSFAARIGRAGRILIGNREYDSPSGALSDAVGSSRNGWRDWRLERTGETLEQVRERFRSLRRAQ
ncbi:GmrSD restriction endonuclease domain-containing protein [Gordonia sp. NPDC003950]